jgi:hypothetical protein
LAEDRDLESSAIDDGLDLEGRLDALVAPNRPSGLDDGLQVKNVSNRTLPAVSHL